MLADHGVASQEQRLGWRQGVHGLSQSGEPGSNVALLEAPEQMLRSTMPALRGEADRVAQVDARW